MDTFFSKTLFYYIVVLYPEDRDAIKSDVSEYVLSVLHWKVMILERNDDIVLQMDLLMGHSIWNTTFVE